MDARDWVHTRFINHSCFPNAIPLKHSGTLAAMIKIRYMREILIDYNRWPWKVNAPWDFVCHCDNTECRGRIRGGGGKLILG